MVAEPGSNIIERWPEESREAAKLVLDKYGEPHEATDSQLIWHDVGEWKRIVTGERNADDARDYYAEEFLNARRGRPTPYMDKLRFGPDPGAADPDERALSDEDLE